jgi:hypothetical protein
MKQAEAHLQIHIHKVNGSTTTFVQNDAGEIRKIFAGVQPTEIFNRDIIAFTNKNSITSLPASQITRIDLISEQLSNLNFPVGMVEAVELSWTEFQALVRSPVMLEQWRLKKSQDLYLVTLLDLEMVDGQRLYFTMETQVERLRSESWNSRGFMLNGTVLCFRMRTGGISLLNLTHLTRLTFFPNPVPSPADVWEAEKCDERQSTKHIFNGESGAYVVGNESARLADKQLYFERKENKNEPESQVEPLTRD